MSSDSLFTSNRLLSESTFNQLSAAMQAIAHSASQEALIITEATLPSSTQLEQEAWLKESGIQRFCLVVSPGFSGLLLAKKSISASPPITGDTDRSKGDRQSAPIAYSDSHLNAYETCLSFDPAAIAPFLLDLQPRFSPPSEAFWSIKKAHQELQPNHPQWQSQFALKLAEALSNGVFNPENGDRHRLANGDEGDRAELPAIATYQTQLYEQLQQQAQVLEQKFIKRTQELHDALSAAQSASLAKTEFLASISHELRTPLTAIIGMSATLLRMSTDARREQFIPPEKQQDYLKIIRNSGEHLLELINDILDLSQVESGRTVLDIREFSLTHIASESLKLLGSKAQEKGVALELEIKLADGATDAANRDRFTADPRRVQQILLNLLSNAIKFTSAGGRVTLRIWVAQGNAIFQIEDTGIGIPEHQFPLLFKKFQQLDTSYHRQYGGTGLGLALTRQLVELHGGQIQVESTVDVGSVFTVHLPAQPLSVESIPAHPLKDGKKQNLAKGAPLLQGRVVLLESHEATATLLCELLTAAGHQVVWMIDGMTAIQQIELLKPEAVVVNTQLTGMGINEFLQRLRQNSVTQSTKVMVLTEEKNKVRDRWLQAGADDVFSLPIEYPEVLLDQVACLINHYEYSIDD